MKAALSQAGFKVLGGVHERNSTLFLIGPNGPDFWPILTAAPEFQDGVLDPVDRYSARVLTTIASNIGAEALFPFGGPPFQPFISWALKSKRCFVSPAQFLVHGEHGLFVSFRGALRMQGHHPFPTLA